MKIIKFILRCLPVISLAFALQGCGSVPHTSAPMPPERFKELGTVSGEACGSLGFLPTVANFIPMGLGSRQQRAYQDALSKAPGATSLINVKINESWAWGIVASFRCANVSGTAIQELL